MLVVSRPPLAARITTRWVDDDDGARVRRTATAVARGATVCMTHARRSIVFAAEACATARCDDDVDVDDARRRRAFFVFSPKPYLGFRKNLLMFIAQFQVTLESTARTVHTSISIDRPTLGTPAMIFERSPPKPHYSTPPKRIHAMHSLSQRGTRIPDLDRAVVTPLHATRPDARRTPHARDAHIERFAPHTHRRTRIHASPSRAKPLPSVHPT